MPPTDPLAYSPCHVPLRRAMNVFGGISITAHEGCYYDILEADRRWRLNGGNALYDIRQGDTGWYNCRPSAGHSRAVAGDWNWSTNGMTSKRTPCPGDMPVAFYELCWEPLGYGWGAQWNSKCDRMHISKLRSEGGDGVLYRKWSDADEEDDMTPAQEAKLDKLIDLLEEKEGGVRKEHLDIIENRLVSVETKVDQLLTRP